MGCIKSTCQSFLQRETPPPSSQSSEARAAQLQLGVKTRQTHISSANNEFFPVVSFWSIYICDVVKFKTSLQR